MTSILTNTSAMNALKALQGVNKGLATTQDRISTGLQVANGGDNAAYFQISKTMEGDKGATDAVSDGLTSTKNSISTARLGAESIQDLATQFLEKVAFAQGAKGGFTEVEGDLKELVKQMETTLAQSTFNGDDMLGAESYTVPANFGAGVVDATDGSMTAVTNADATVGASRQVVTGITRAGGYGTTTLAVGTYDMASLVKSFSNIATNFATNASSTVAVAGPPVTSQGAEFLAGILATTEGVLDSVTDIATKLGQSEKSITNQQEFLKSLSDNIDSGIGAMVDADMEEEAARLTALQTQQQLATQALSIANQGPSNVMSLFR